MGIERLKIGSPYGMIHVNKTKVLKDVFNSMKSEKEIDFYFSKRQSGITSSYLLYLLGEFMFSFDDTRYLVVSHHSNCAKNTANAFWYLLGLNDFEVPKKVAENKFSYNNGSSIEFVGFNDWLDHSICGRKYENIIFDNYTYYSHKVVFCKFMPMSKKIRCFSTYE